MNIKFEAMDGTIFSTKWECEEYEAKLNEDKNEDKSFTVQYCTDYEKPHICTYHGDGTNFDLQTFVECYHAFKIIDGKKNWNNFVNENFPSFDDDIYYKYECPSIEDKDVNEWLCYNMSGELELFDVYFISMTNYIEKLEEIQTMLN